MARSEDEEETSQNRKNKLLIEAMTAKMEQLINNKMGRIMDSQLDALHQELQQKKNRARQRKEQELNPKPPDKTLRSTWSSPHKTSHTPKSMSYSDYHSANAPKLYKFSGKGNYFEWERNMDEWLYYHKIMKKERLSFAASQLTGDAYKWLLQEVDDRWYYKEPTITLWEDLKELLRNKYARKSSIPKEAYSTQPKQVLKHVLKEKLEATQKPQPKKTTELVVVHKQSLKPSPQPVSEPKQCKSSNHSKSKEVTCYKCIKKRHFAVTCPEKLSSQNSSSGVVNPSLENSSSCVMHLLLPKNVDSGHNMEHGKERAEGSIKEKNQHLVSSTSQAFQDNECEQTANEKRVVTKPSPTSAICASNVIVSKAEILPNILLGTQVSLSYECIRYWNNFTVTRNIKQPVLYVEISSIIHLILLLSAKEDTGRFDVCNGLLRTTSTRCLTMEQTEEVTRCNSLQSNSALKACFLANNEREFTQDGKVFVHNQSLRAECIILIKEKPPDAPQPIKSRGNYLDSQKRMKANPLSLGAECTILGLRPYQWRELEVAIQTTPFPEQTNPKQISDGKLFSHQRSQAQDHFDVYLEQIRVKHQGHIGRQSNPFKKAGEVKQHLFSEQPSLLFVYIEALPSLTNLAPVLPSEIILLLQDYEDKFLEGNHIRLTPICDDSQNHIWRPGDYLGRPRTVLHEIWITSLHMFFVELKRDELVTNNALMQEEPPDVKTWKYTIKTLGIKEEPPDAHQLDLQGKYNVSPSFNVSDLVPFVADQTDLRTNPFQVGEDDASMDTDKLVAEENMDHGEEGKLVAEDAVARSNTKFLNQTVESLITQIKIQEHPHKGILMLVQAN